MVTVNLTSLLVLVTLFISVSDSLPRTSYVKLIDIWLIFNLLVPFTDVLLHTTIDALRTNCSQVGSDVRVRQRGSDREAVRNNKTKVLRVLISVGKFGLPLAYLIFGIIYFGSGLSIRYSGQGSEVATTLD